MIQNKPKADSKAVPYASFDAQTIPKGVVLVMGGTNSLYLEYAGRLVIRQPSLYDNHSSVYVVPVDKGAVFGPFTGVCIDWDSIESLHQ